MEGIGERINLIIQKEGITKTRFAERLKVTPAYITKLINKGAVPSDRLIDDICSLFNVNADWLRTGKGKPFLDKDDALINELATKYQLSEVDKEIFRAYFKLSEQERSTIRSFAFSLAGKIMDNPVLYWMYKKREGKLPLLSERDIDMEVESFRNELMLQQQVARGNSAPGEAENVHYWTDAKMHAELQRQLDAEKEETDEPSTSSSGNSGTAIA